VKGGVLQNTDRLTVNEFCTRLSPFLKNEICSEGYVSELLKFSELFPDLLHIYHLGFEFPLFEEVAGPDFAFLVNPISYEEWISSGRDLFLQSLQTKSVYSDLFRFMHEGLEDRLLFQDAQSISIAFDYIHSKKVHFSSPNFYIFPSDQCDFETFIKNTDRKLRKIDSDCEEIFSELKKLCSQSLLRPIAAAWMTARKSSGFRIVLVDQGLISKATLAVYLKPSDEKEKFLNFIELLSPYLERTKLLVDVQSPSKNTIGVECYVARSLPVEEQKKRWHAIFTHASEYGLIANKNHWNPYISWFGGHTEPNADATAGYRFVRVISHVKFIYKPEAGIKMKLYLGAHYRLIAL